MNDNEIFERFPDFIREYIYSHSWDSLRAVQTAAAKSIFGTENNLLLTSSTASGKTEAAFFPILSLMWEDMPRTVGVLYIAPLKSLINDQFGRIEELLDMTGIPVTHWHGDVAASHKKKLLDEPRGVLQITPESLESMLINRQNDIPRIFGDLRFVVIDEIHTLTGSDRGNQIICQLCRIAGLIGHSPRRIGLSATVGDPKLAAEWLAEGSGRATDIPQVPPEKLRWRLGMEHFYVQNPSYDQTAERAQDALCGGLPLCARTLARSGADILLDRHVREQGVLLKQVADAALLRRQVDMPLAVEQRAAVQHDPAPVRAHDTGDAAQRHALAAAGRAEQRHGLVFRLERHAQVERAEFFLDVDRNTHAAAPFPRFSSRLTASSTTAEIARLTATQKNACRSSFVRQS